VDEICRWGGGHPFILQLLSKRAIETGDVDRAVATVARDRSMTSLFAVDMDLLDDEQRSILQLISRDRGGPAESDLSVVRELALLGLVETGQEDRLRTAVPFLRNWLITD
jgi:hypothetical protein